MLSLSEDMSMHFERETISVGAEDGSHRQRTEKWPKFLTGELEEQRGGDQRAVVEIDMGLFAGNSRGAARPHF